MFFGNSALHLARLEGGTLGAAFGIPTGLIAYCVILKGHVTPKQVAIVVFRSLVGGCAPGVALIWLSAFVTPILTLAIAAWVRLGEGLRRVG